MSDIAGIEDATVTLIKGGEVCIEAILHRSTTGLTLNVRAHPAVEDFVRSMGTGEVTDIRMHGRHWVPADGRVNGNRRNPPGEQGPLMIYQLSVNPGLIPLEDGTAFRIDKPGWQLNDVKDQEDQEAAPAAGGRRFVMPTTQQVYYKTVTNLSFLRLVGISEGAGVKFGVDGVFTTEEVDRLASRIQLSARRFYVQYMKTITQMVTVSRQEIPN